MRHCRCRFMAEKKAGGAFQSVSCRSIPMCYFETTLLKTAQVVNKDRTQSMMSKTSRPGAVPVLKLLARVFKPSSCKDCLVDAGLASVALQAFKHEKHFRATSGFDMSSKSLVSYKNSSICHFASWSTRCSPSSALFPLATFARIPATNHHTTVRLFAIVHPVNAGSWLGKTHVCSDADTDVLTNMV